MNPYDTHLQFGSLCNTCGYSPCTCECTTTCPVEVCGIKCPIQLETRCVYYDNYPNASELQCLGITNGTRLDAILKTIDQKMCAINPSFNLFNLACLRDRYIINDQKQFAESVAAELCSINDKINTAANNTTLNEVKDQVNYIMYPQFTATCAGVGSSMDIKQVLNAILNLICLPVVDNSPSVGANQTQTISWTLSGPKNHTLQADVRISTSFGNVLTKNNDGLFVPTPPSQIFQTISYDPNTQQICMSHGGGCFSLSLPAYAPQTISYNPTTKQLSISGGNSQDLSSLASSFTQTPLVANDTPTIDFSQGGVDGHTISANVKIDPAAGNALAATASGLYVAQSLSADEKVKVNAADALGGYLVDKILGITDECITVSAAPSSDGTKLELKATLNESCLKNLICDLITNDADFKLCMCGAAMACISKSLYRTEIHLATVHITAISINGSPVTLTSPTYGTFQTYPGVHSISITLASSTDGVSGAKKIQIIDQFTNVQIACANYVNGTYTYTFNNVSVNMFGIYIKVILGTC